ncbi:hypothetical protein KC359_g8923 [Hortaea werneckii]|nr:hypothetical protein KC359_g8923 [Hortaea werneckii]
MPDSARKKMDAERKLNEIRDEIELAVSDKKMTREMTVDMMTYLVQMMHNYVNEHKIPVKGEISTGLETTFRNMTVNEQIPEDEEPYMGGGVMLNQDKNDISLRNKRAHLFVICCICDKCIVIEYEAKRLPEFTSSFVNLPKDGCVYSVCKPCARERKYAAGGTNAFDWGLKDMFYNGDVCSDPTMYEFVKKTMTWMTGINVKMIMHKNKDAYLTKDIIEKAMTNEDGILHLKKYINEKGHESVKLDWYEAASFLTI